MSVSCCFLLLLAELSPCGNFSWHVRGFGSACLIPRQLLTQIHDALFPQFVFSISSVLFFFFFFLLARTTPKRLSEKFTPIMLLFHERFFDLFVVFMVDKNYISAQKLLKIMPSECCSESLAANFSSNLTSYAGITRDFDVKLLIG